MAESGLSIGWTELQQEVGGFLGYGRANWNAAQTAEIAAIVQSGVRRVYYPMGIPEVAGYDWSWLRPTTTLAITLAGGYDYDLPDDFGRLIGKLHYGPDENYAPIQLIPLDRLLQMKVREDREDTPYYAAIRRKTEDRTTGQRWELLLWPKPDASYTLYYSYEAYSGPLSDSYPYPLGGMSLAELFIESCLAVAEQRLNDEIGVHTQTYQALLLDAVQRDKKHSPTYFGYMGHTEYQVERRLHGDVSPYSIIYKGQSI